MAKTPSNRRSDRPKTESPSPEIDQSVEDAEILSEEPPPPDVTSPPEPEQSSPDPAELEQAVPVVQNPRSGFIPMVLGGAVAAGLGYGAAYLTLPLDDGSSAAALVAQSQQITDLSARVSGLNTEIGALKSVPGPEAALSVLETNLSDQIAASGLALGAAVTALSDRLDAVERAPNADGSLPQTAIDAFNTDIEALRAEVAAQAAEMQTLAAAAADQLEQTRASAQEIEANAAAASRDSTLRVALSRVQSALESGVPYAQDLPDLELAIGAPVPAALVTPAADGLPTLLALQTAFPDAARAALATARAEGVSGEDDSTVTGFLRTLFDVRSVEPRQGTTVDAALSRAEAALGQGRLSDTIAEIGTLPEIARTDFTEWLALAQSRLDALAAIEALSLSLTEN